ncbi:hypothetical protein KCU81_g3938, partial [Aureobasidium melanogenum]|uniref:F-box domain-containing protein n=1 Tax=Aureobasidium melanogenum (strain CBS 110374) TaxID=1043003 RepID=A0A074VPS3_AURM1
MSLINLPLEIRLLVYDFLLYDALSDNICIIYRGCKRESDNQIFFETFRARKNIPFHAMIKPQIWHIDICNLLNLAATCHQLRSELLFLAWSNADICINLKNKEPETLMGYAEFIFNNRLSKICCDFIRTLQINVLEVTWEPRHTRAIAEIIHRCLPRLGKLTVHVIREWNSVDSDRPQKALCALGTLEPRIAVELRTEFIRPFLFMSVGQQLSDTQIRARQQKRARADAAHLEAIRSVGQRRRRTKMAREQKDEVLDILQDTVDIRSQSMSSKRSETDLQQQH